MQYKISIIHPSRSRPHQAEKTIQLWLDNAKDKSHIEYIISVDIDDRNLKAYKELSSKYGTNIHIAKNKSAIEAINRGTKRSKGNLILVVSDDFLCEKNWDEKLLKELEGKEDFIVKTQDGIQPTLITLPIMDRTYYNRFGYVYETGYLHMFCDQEMTAVGMMLGKVINSQQVFEHIHYSTGKFEKDAISEKNDKTWNQGKKHFAERLKTNFGISDPVMKYSDIKWH